MSKRYGRNQRRRHRMTIQTLHGQLHQQRHDHEHDVRQRVSMLLEENIELKYVVQRICDIVGESHIAFPPGTVELYGAWGESFDLPVSLPQCPITPGVRLPSERAKVDRNRLDVFCTRIDIDEIRNQVHFKVDYGHRHYGYAVSRSVVASTPPRKLSQQICSQLVLLLEHDIVRFQNNRGPAPWRR